MIHYSVLYIYIYIYIYIYYSIDPQASGVGPPDLSAAALPAGERLAELATITFKKNLTIQQKVIDEKEAIKYYDDGNVQKAAKSPNKMYVSDDTLYLVPKLIMPSSNDTKTSNTNNNSTNSAKPRNDDSSSSSSCSNNDDNTDNNTTTTNDNNDNNNMEHT